MITSPYENMIQYFSARTPVVCPNRAIAGCDDWAIVFFFGSREHGFSGGSQGRCCDVRRSLRVTISPYSAKHGNVSGQWHLLPQAFEAKLQRD